MNIEQAKRRRAEVVREMTHISQQSTITTEDKIQFNKLEVEAKELRQFIDDPRNQSTRPPADPLGDQAGPETWVDKNGREARLLSPSQSVRSTISPGSKAEVSLGAYLRSMALGPRNDSERRALAEGTDSAGGWTVPAPLATELIDRLRARAVCFKAGAKTVVMPSATYTIARLATDPQAYWRTENAVIPEGDPTFEGLIFRARACGVLVKISMELLEDSANIDEVLPGVFGKVAALEIDRVALVGSGDTLSPSANEPLGIANQSGVGSHRLDAHISSYDCILDAVNDLAVANANFPTAAVMNPSVATEFAKLKDSLGQPLRRPEAVADLSFASTTQLPTNETGGSPSGNDTSRIIVGDFTNLLVGIRTEARVLTLKERFVDYGQFAFMLWLRADIQLAHAASFSQVLGVM